MSKVNLQEVIFTPADAAEALETIAGLEKDERGSIPARLMYDDPHKPPTWWHVRHMLNLTLLARTAAAQEGTAPSPGNPPQMSFVEDPVNNGAALLRLKAKLMEWKDGTEPIPPAILPTYVGQTWIDIDSLDYRFDRPEPHPDPEFHREARWKMSSSLSNLLETIHPTEETIHSSRCHICYDESDLNIRIAPDYYFAKGVPGVIADVKMSEIAGVELTHPRAVASSADTVRRCFRQIAEGGRSERLLNTSRQRYAAPVEKDRVAHHLPRAGKTLHDQRHPGVGPAAALEVPWRVHPGAGPLSRRSPLGDEIPASRR